MKEVTISLWVAGGGMFHWGYRRRTRVSVLVLLLGILLQVRIGSVDIVRTFGQGHFQYICKVELLCSF